MNRFKGFLNNLPVIITLAGFAVAGIMGWCDQQSSTEYLAERMGEFEENGSKLARINETKIEIFKETMKSYEKNQMQFREDNRREHTEIKIMLKDILNKK
jgi:hypothetical protein